MLVAFSVAPSGTSGDDSSVSEAVAAAVCGVRASGLVNHTDAMFTTVEGPDWDTVMDVVKRAAEAVGEFAPRVSLVLMADIRPGFAHQIEAKVEREEAILARDEPV